MGYLNRRGRCTKSSETNESRLTSARSSGGGGEFVTYSPDIYGYEVNSCTTFSGVIGADDQCSSGASLKPQISVIIIIIVM